MRGEALVGYKGLDIDCGQGLSELGSGMGRGTAFFLFLLLNCMFYQLLCVPHSTSSTQSWGSELPSIVEMRDQNSKGCPLLFSNRNLGSFCA